jgi:hypothetical protein
VLKQVLLIIFLLIQKRQQGCPDRHRVVYHAKWIDIHIKEVLIQVSPNIIGETGSQHEDGGPVVYLERVWWDGNFSSEMHGNSNKQ